MSATIQDHTFSARKARIIAEITSGKPDLSPKGSIDVQILPLIDRLNSHPDMVTTSSCSGRVSVFLEGAKELGAFGGKGEGGRWLYVSHDPLKIEGLTDAAAAQMLFGGPVGAHSGTTIKVQAMTRFVHFKFETMILHILARDLATAQTIVSTAISTGFRESGIMNATKNPIVAIRSNGLALDAIVGLLGADGTVQKLVSDEYIAMLARVGNTRFRENDVRIAKLMQSLEEALFAEKKTSDNVWEDKDVRKARKREEGLRQQEEAKRTKANSEDVPVDED